MYILHSIDLLENVSTCLDLGQDETLTSLYFFEATRFRSRNKTVTRVIFMLGEVGLKMELGIVSIWVDSSPSRCLQL